MTKLTLDEAAVRYADLDYLEKHCFWRNGVLSPWVSESPAVLEGAPPVLYALSMWGPIAHALMDECELLTQELVALRQQFDKVERWVNSTPYGEAAMQVEAILSLGGSR